jgi:hypothetical protein
LDEFEKTTKDIHQALLLPFDNGKHVLSHFWPDHWRLFKENIKIEEIWKQ